MVVVHDLTSACCWADHVVAVSQGRVVAQGPPAQARDTRARPAALRVESVLVRDPVSGAPLVVPVRRCA